MKGSQLDVFNRYLKAQVAVPENTREPRPLAITISREAGAGAIMIAELLDKRKAPGIGEGVEEAVGLSGITLSSGE